jgi:hypothetical protein
MVGKIFKFDIAAIWRMAIERIRIVAVHCVASKRFDSQSVGVLANSRTEK